MTDNKDYVVLGSATEGFRCEVGHWSEDEQYATTRPLASDPELIAPELITLWIEDGEVRAR